MGSMSMKWFNALACQLRRLSMSIFLSLPQTRTLMYTIIFTDFLIVDNNAGKRSITMWMSVIFTRQLMTSTSSLHALTDPVSNIYNIICINFPLLFFFWQLVLPCSITCIWNFSFLLCAVQLIPHLDHVLF